MAKRVVFNIEEGSFEQGFPVTIRIWETAQPHYREVRGKFPPAPQIHEYYNQWQDIYRRLGVIQRITVPPSQITNVSNIEECEAAANVLEVGLNEWLNQPAVRSLERKLLRAIGSSEPARFILQTQNSQLRRFPWHLWSFFQECYPQTEITLCAETEPYSKRLRSPVKILAILGNNADLNIKEDCQLLEALPGAAVTFLVEPDRHQIDDHLWKQPWDILFFAGHSETQGEQGRIYINAQESLTLDELKDALRRAIAHGLQLAIFNSCDGLGLAKYLTDLKIPYMIVMREPIPDVVAQRFARHFLEAFARGEPFYTAVQVARLRLRKDMEHEFPCASWLPVIFQNPLAPELKYPRPVHWKKGVLAVAGAVIAAIAAGFLVDTVQFRNRLSKGEKILIPSVQTPDKIAGVQTLWWKGYPQAVSKFENSLRQNRNDPETVIYLNNARIGDRPAFEVAAVVPIGSNLDVAQEMLRGVAQAQDEINLRGGIQGKPLKVTIANDDNHPDIARRIAVTFVKNPQMLAVIGHNASDASVAAAPVYNQGELVMITPTSFSDKLSSSGKYIFRMVPSIWYVADKLAEYIRQAVPHAKVAICSDEAAPDNESFRNQFTTALLKKKITFINVNCDFSDPSFEPRTAIAQIISRDANTLLLAPHVDRVRKVVEMAQANQGRLPLFGSPTPYTAETLFGKAAVSGLTLVVPWHPAALPENPFPHLAIQRWGGKVNWRTAMTYDAVWAIATALQQNQTRQGLKDILRSPDFSTQGASGTVQFLPSGERQIVPGIGVLVRVQPDAQSPTGYDFVPLNK
ncbi:ABC transporter substrate-binding protein [Leptothermofonsia sp. ETS-13]|uniref:ABC transporter substrate-binding protein n=1 Tax=Leptothermofonsia sp. ETS-13 TaxID=3035696 RepID=UPI003B9E1F10